MNIKMKHIFVLFGATAVLSSCVDDLSFDAPKENKLDEIYFTASIAKQDFFGAKKSQTRSVADARQRVQAGFYDLAIDGRNDIRLSVSTLDGMFGKSVPMPEDGKNNAKTRGAMLTELAQKPMSVIEYVQTSDGKTIVGEPYTAYTEDGYTWGGSHIQQSSNAVSRTLHAIYPSSECYTIDPAAGTMSYTTPESPADQSDLLYAVESHGLGTEQKETVHLTFDHLLTAVRFKVGSQQLPMSIIKSISIDGISISGTYSFSNRRWDLSNATTGKVSCPLNFNVTGAENIIINGGQCTFMLLPQKLTPNAIVTIAYKDYTEGEGSTTRTKTLTASLATSGTPAWEAGQSITYTLMDHEGNNEYILEVEEPEEFSPKGGKQDINIISYRQKEGERTPMRWMVQSYSSDGGNTWMSGGATNVPAGMSISPTEGTRDTTSVNISLNVAKTVEDVPHREFLRYRTPLGHNGEAFDLSRHDYLNAPCAQTTANCYVVDAPGKYRIPTAYGNAIVDGKTNQDAYTDKAGYKHCDTKNNFMTHNGKAITAPMIRNNGINLSHATLVWEDVEELIDHNSIKLVDDGNAIEFEILADKIDQGNAVIAAMDGNNVAWSWHIWVTDEKATLAEPIEDKNMYGEQVDFMPLTLGWCSTAKASGQIGREAAVRITMPEYLSKQACIRIRQNSTPATDVYRNNMGNATYYNWGRKDPFPGAMSTETPYGSDETASALPKPFYQAGDDAAALGMHAELHTEYSTNVWSLLGQGALVGLNGFMTGMAIKHVYNYYKEAAKTTPKVAKEALAEHFEPVDYYDKDEFMREFMTNVSNGRVEKAMPESMAKIIQSKGYNIKNITVYAKGYSGVVDKAVTIVDNVTNKPVLVFPWGESPEGYFRIMAPHAVEYVSEAASVANYSKSLMARVGVALSSGFHIGSVFTNASLFSGSTDWCREMSSHGVSVNYGIQHPNILLRDPISWVNHDGVGNLWNAGQIDYDEKDRPVVKSIYDPCPAGYCVPSQRDMSGLTDATTGINIKLSTAKETVKSQYVSFPALGCRNFWGASEPGAAVTNNINEMIYYNGEQGFYWTSSPSINQDEDGEKGAYAVNFRGNESWDEIGKEGVKYHPRVTNDLKLQPSYALPIRPVREKGSPL